jgi:hypothetical protein
MAKKKKTELKPPKRKAPSPKRKRPTPPVNPPIAPPPIAPSATSRSDYQRIKEEAAERRRDASKAGRDIGELPPVKDPQRKAAALACFVTFCKTYFAGRFYLPWSADQHEVAGEMERVALHGGQLPIAMPRGSGKTVLSEALCLWCVLKGIHRFVMLLAASKRHALESISAVKAELETNDLLLEDFPEACFPIRALEGITNRCLGQLHNGERTRIGWKTEEIVLPTIPGSPASGAIFRVSGITGSGVRGPKFTRSDGRTVRPSLVVLDDAQTDESAGSDAQTEKRERLVLGAVLGMAGPDDKITLVNPCTVIRRGDLSDRLLTRWNARRYKMVYAFPTNMGLWEEYATRRADEKRNGGDGSGATEFYKQHQEEMDAGAVVAWPERKPGAWSAVEYAMSLYFEDKAAFYAEYQNEPLEEQLGEGQLVAIVVAARVIEVARGEVPLWATRLTAFIDVQGKLLYWLVAGWADNFTGQIVDYGSWPDQGRRYFTLADAQKTLSRAFPGGLEASIYAGLGKCAEHVIGREWRRQGGAGLKVERCLVDANWGKSTNTVYDWCRQSVYGAIVMPSHGRYVGAASKPWHEYQKRPGERLGLHWLITAAENKRAVRHALVDVNWWKSFVAERLNTPIGAKGALTLFGSKGEDHRMLADHWTAEYAVRTSGRGREVDEWKMRPSSGEENHLWDCAVGAAAAASMLGVQLLEQVTAGKSTKPRLSNAEKQRRQLEAWEQRKRAG